MSRQATHIISPSEKITASIKTSENATGPIAQDLLEANPELVRQGDDGYYQVSELSQWTLVKAIQELKAENNELKKRIEALESIS